MSSKSDLQEIIKEIPKKIKEHPIISSIYAISWAICLCGPKMIGIDRLSNWSNNSLPDNANGRNLLCGILVALGALLLYILNKKTKPNPDIWYANLIGSGIMSYFSFGLTKIVVKSLHKSSNISDKSKDLLIMTSFATGIMFCFMMMNLKYIYNAQNGKKMD